MTDSEVLKIGGFIERHTVELPIELHEHIIGLLDSYHDAGTLANCALVCRQWLPSSRSKLYHVVALNSSKSWAAFQRHMSLSATSVIVRYLKLVRRLCIWSGDRVRSFEGLSSDLHLGGREGQERPWTHLVLIECASRLAGITHIELRKIDYSLPYT